MLLLALAATTTWIIRDNTDNLTGVRDVHAVAVSSAGVAGEDETRTSAALTLSCEKTGLRLRLS